MSVKRTIWLVVVVVVIVTVFQFLGGEGEGVINVACYTSTV